MKWTHCEDPENLPQWWPQMGKCKKTRMHQYSFMISISSSQCNFSMTRQQLYRLESFAHNTDIHMSGKKRSKPTIDPKWEDNYLHTPYLLSYQDCLIFQQQLVFNIETNGSVKESRWTGNIRSSDDSKWQASMWETDVDRSWQAGYGKP